ncbi:MAG: GNAT family N-acetyltransferase [Nanoarchaeota archaeon]|nr:GNAT family N-acetyltransferase [Nanoarchaeota archaeon]
MKIRLVKEKEINTLCKMIRLNYSKEYEKRAKAEIKAMFKNYTAKPQYLAAEIEGKIVGFAGYIQSWMDWHFYNIFWVNVHPDYQHKGIGTALVKEIIKILKTKKGEDKAEFILLTTTSPGFYIRLGFKVIQKSGKKNCFMIKKLR